MKNIRKWNAALLIVILLLGLIAVPGIAQAKNSKNKVKLNKTSITLTVGKTTTLKLKNAPKGKKIVWSSNKKKVATVSKKGKVTAKSAGKAKITAKVGKKKYTCTVTVKKKKVTTEASTTETTEITTEATTEATTETTTEATTEAPKVVEDETVTEGGIYTSRDKVALYIHTFGKLPSNFITKNEAKALGWTGGSLLDVAPQKCIGGDYFSNYEKKLPEKAGRNYHECDINTLGALSRGAERIVYSNDGLIFYTADHYETFTQLY